MKILVVSEDPSTLFVVEQTLEQNYRDAVVEIHSNIAEVSDRVHEQQYDIVMLDLNGDVNALFGLAKLFEENKPRQNILLISDSDCYAMDAIQVRASGYIVKPVTAEKLRYELDDLRYPICKKLLRVNCFGSFDVFTSSGEMVKFKRTKSKELLAILAGEKGATLTVKELSCRIFGEEGKSPKKMEYMQQLISAMMQGLSAVGAEAVINKTYNSIGINIDKVDCIKHEFEVCSVDTSV